MDESIGQSAVCSRKSSSKTDAPVEGTVCGVEIDFGLRVIFVAPNRDSNSSGRLVSYRYGRGSILITTNKGIRDWPEILAGDEVLATAILDRLLHHSHVLDIKGRSYRLRDLEHAVANST